MVIALVLAQSFVTEPCTQTHCGPSHTTLLTVAGVTLENASVPGSPGCVPVIATSGVRRWLVVELEGTPIECWVAATVHGKRLLAALDIQVEGTGPIVRLVQSSDAGRTWSQLKQIDKPHRLAHVKRLSVSRAGAWKLVLLLDEPVDGVEAGTYEVTQHGTTQSR